MNKLVLAKQSSISIPHAQGGQFTLKSNKGSDLIDFVNEVLSMGGYDERVCLTSEVTKLQDRINQAQEYLDSESDDAVYDASCALGGS